MAAYLTLFVLLAASPMQLLRANDICGRMLYAFGRQHGYVYLRSVLVDLINRVTELPPDCSLELDPSKLPPGEDLSANIQNLTAITQAFIEVILESVSTIPPVFQEVCHHIGKVV